MTVNTAVKNYGLVTRQTISVSISHDSWPLLGQCRWQTKRQLAVDHASDRQIRAVSDDARAPTFVWNETKHLRCPRCRQYRRVWSVRSSYWLNAAPSTCHCYLRPAPHSPCISVSRAGATRRCHTTCNIASYSRIHTFILSSDNKFPK